jgi:hypothetical protein
MAQILPSIKTFLEAEAKAKAILVKLQNDPASVVPDPVYTAVDTALAQITDIRQQLQNNQMSVLPLPVVDGGLPGVTRFISANILNTRDTRRPDVDMAGYVAGFLLLLPGPDLSTARVLQKQVASAFITADHIRRAANLEKLEKSVKYELSTEMNRIARSAAPITPSPWVSVKLSDFVPGAVDMLRKVEGFLGSIASHKPASQLDGFAQFAQASTSSIAVTIAAIDATISAIEQAFPSAALKLLKFPAQVGGTPAVSASIGGWLDQRQYPQLLDITTNTLVAGVFVMWGGSVQAPVTALYDLLESLILP